ncbi:uncharacterized protein [Dermacentor albipictus]|uniref:uncharacterized protein isoform X2 n=1 Tax=Dermacentor albipictus TaxID=60249 RepID=UPI0038FC3798
MAASSSAAPLSQGMGKPGEHGPSHHHGFVRDAQAVLDIMTKILQKVPQSPSPSIAGQMPATNKEPELKNKPGLEDKQHLCGKPEAEVILDAKDKRRFEENPHSEQKPDATDTPNVQKPRAETQSSSVRGRKGSESIEGTASRDEDSSDLEASVEEGLSFRTFWCGLQTTQAYSKDGRMNVLKLVSVSVRSGSLLMPEGHGRWVTAIASIVAVSLAVTLFAVLYNVLKEGVQAGSGDTARCLCRCYAKDVKAAAGRYIWRASLHTAANDAIKENPLCVAFFGTLTHVMGARATGPAVWRAALRATRSTGHIAFEDKGKEWVYSVVSPNKSKDGCTPERCKNMYTEEEHMTSSQQPRHRVQAPERHRPLVVEDEEAKDGQCSFEDSGVKPALFMVHPVYSAMLQPPRSVD